MRPNHTDINIILDRSGSMGSLRTHVTTGMAQLIKTQKSAPGTANLTLALFSSGVDRPVIDAQDIQDVSSFRYQTGGGTALRDAIGTQIRKTSQRLASTPEESRPERVVFIVVTDGRENQSQTYDEDTLKNMINNQENVYNWEFLFIGANQDAFKVGERMGIKAGKALSFDQSGLGMSAAFLACAGALTRFRTSGAPHSDQWFTETDHTAQENLGAASAPRGSQ